MGERAISKYRQLLRTIHSFDFLRVFPPFSSLQKSIFFSRAPFAKRANHMWENIGRTLPLRRISLFPLFPLSLSFSLRCLRGMEKEGTKEGELFYVSGFQNTPLPSSTAV